MSNAHRDENHNNTSQLHIDRAGERGIIHRDYIAHCFRWSFALNFIDSRSRVLDLGCGDGPLLKTLYTNKYHPDLYVGIDVRDVGDKLIKTNFPVNFFKIDIAKEKLPLMMDTFDTVVSYEVFEHFPPKDVDHVLREVARVLKKGGLFLISTPNFNGKQATNHIHEWEQEELNEHIRKFFKIKAEYGTFSSRSDIYPVLSPAEKEVYDKLHDYYDSNIISVFLAPLHPAQSRNILRVCEKL